MKQFPAGTLLLKNRRGTPTRLLNKGRPAAKVTHFRAPLKGLSRHAELGDADPLLASIMTNWVVEDDRITVRPGYIKTGQIAANTPISTMIPYYGSPTQKIVAAAGTQIYDTSGASISTGWTGDDWSWTYFANLSSTDYTVMVNGHDGVVSWDGTTFVKETVTAPSGATWVNPLRFDKVLSHMNRLWFADSDNLALYYLPVQQKTGALFLLPLNAMFKRGGYITAVYTWTIDGGLGLDDAIVIFSSNGEAVIYSGVDPASDFKLIGIFRFDAPMSKNSVVNFGGDLYALISSGFVPMTTLLKAESENLGQIDLGVMKDFTEIARPQRDTFGWQVILNQQTGHAICNMPLGGGKYQQMVQRLSNKAWTKWTDIPSRCWGWLSNHLYFGDDKGGIYLGGEEYLNDNGAAINADVRFTWSSYKSVAKKNFKMMRLYLVTDGLPRPFMDLEVDYDNLPPVNQPEVTFGPGGGADWNTATWDVSDWAFVTQPRQDWQGITGLGRVGAPRIRVSVSGCTFSLSGVDVLYELGGLM
jgi:hypothetical protein